MKTEDIVKYALIAVGAYLVWEYVVSPMMAGTAATPAPAPSPAATTQQNNQQQQQQQSTTGVPPLTGASGGQGTNPPTANVTVTTPPPPSTSSASTAQGLDSLKLATQAANAGAISGATGTLNADQWSYYANQIGMLPVNDFTAAFFPNGRPVNTANYTQYTALQWIIAGDNSNAGISGLGAIIRTPSNMGMGSLRGGLRNRPNAFSGSSRKTSYTVQ
jgi:hypothetical protein